MRALAAIFEYLVDQPQGGWEIKRPLAFWPGAFLWLVGTKRN